MISSTMISKYKQFGYGVACWGKDILCASDLGLGAHLMF